MTERFRSSRFKTVRFIGPVSIVRLPDENGQPSWGVRSLDGDSLLSFQPFDGEYEFELVNHLEEQGLHLLLSAYAKYKRRERLRNGHKTR